VNLDKERIIPREEHGIDRGSISNAALEIVDKLQQAGYEAALVGGCVRDLLLGKRPKDFDVATSASPEQVRDEFRSCRLIGRRFRLAHVRIGREIIEVATFRAGPEDRTSTSSDEHNQGREGQLTRDNVYGTRDEDAVRRDFTVNALYYDPSDETIVDYVDGVADMHNKILRSLGDPKVRFREDPVRMLRIIRFAAKLDFSMDQDAESVIEEMANLLSHVPPARMYEEVLKLFHGGAALKTFEMLREYSLFKYLFPFTDHCLVGMEPGLPERALANTDRRVHEGKPVIPAFLFACLLWDPVREDAGKLLASGMDPGRAWKIAMEDTIRDQCQYVAIPRRLSSIIVEIWSLQASMARRQERTAQGCLTHRRFRAAYDFLLLRAELNEIDPEVAEWWTRIQEVDEDEQRKLISDLGNQDRTGHQGGNAYPNQKPGQHRRSSSGRRRRKNRNVTASTNDQGGAAEQYSGNGNNTQGGQGAAGNGTKRRTSNSKRRRRGPRKAGGGGGQSSGSAGNSTRNSSGNN
jgi:poly(A) polymerase